METNALNELFREWRELTEAESQAIVAEDWTRVNEQQQQKGELKLRISAAIEQLQRARSTQGDYQRRLRHVVAEMISLETANAEMVALHREKARVELDGLERSVGHLRGLNRAYGAQSNEAWSSYS